MPLIDCLKFVKGEPLPPKKRSEQKALAPIMSLRNHDTSPSRMNNNNTNNNNHHHRNDGHLAPKSSHRLGSAQSLPRGFTAADDIDYSERGVCVCVCVCMYGAYE